MMCKQYIMEETKEEMHIKPEFKEECILPLGASEIDLKIISTIKKGDGEFTDTEALNTVGEEVNHQVEVDSETNPTIITSLVKSYFVKLDRRNHEDDLKKINLERKPLVANYKEEYLVAAETPSKADFEKITKEVIEENNQCNEIKGNPKENMDVGEIVIEENNEFYEMKGNFEGEDMDVGEIDCIVNLEQGESLVEYNIEHFALENSDKCFECEETFDSRKSLLEHVKTVHAKTQGPKHSCKICGMEFKYKANYRKHVKLHDDIYHFKCRYCNISFKQSLTLKNHYIYVHETEKPYKCEDCDSAFKSMNNLKAHIEVHHNVTGETFSCDFCHMEFKRRCYLNRHIRVHTNPDKKFTCADCGLKCRSKTDIAKHVLTHIGIVEKRFFCEICGAGFSKQAHLVRHTRTHSVEKCFPCQLCDRAYKDQYSLKTHHETVHLGITFSCEICGFQSDRHSLKKHLKRCEGQKKYTCEVCHKEYYLKKCFEQHMIKFHSIQS